MPSRKLSNWLKSYLEYTENTECPTSFNFWVGVWTIAGALRRRVWLDMGHFQWYPNFYLFLVSPPGIVSKSTTLSIGTKLLEQIPGIKFGPEALTWQALTQAMANSKEEMLVEVPGEMPSFLPMSCLSIAAGELGTLISPANRELIDALVSLWDGKTGAWEKWTKTSGSDAIINPWLNIASCTTPSWIAQNFPEELIGGGFTSRCIFVYAEQKRQLIAYPGLTQSPKKKSLERDLVHDLEVISTFKGAYSLSPDAIEFGTAWYEEHHKKEHSLDSNRFGGYLARKQTHIHKVALIIAASMKNELVITAEELKIALTLVEALEPQMQKVFESIGVEGSGKGLHLIRSVLSAVPKITRVRLFQMLCTKLSVDEFEAALVAGVTAGLWRVEANGRDSYIISNKKEEGKQDAIAPKAPG